jgi:hypothetical protein
VLPTASGLDSVAVHGYVLAMVELRSGRPGRVPKPAAGKAAASARQLEPRPQGGGAAIVVRCLHCRHEAVLSPAELAAHGVKPDSPIAGFVRRLKCSKCGSGSVLAKRIAAPKPPRQRRSA